MTIRMADDLDHIELYLAEHLAPRMEPLVIRLRTRTLGRVGYARLRALLTENAMVMGQMDETGAILRQIERHWRWCVLRYVPWPPRTLAHILPGHDPPSCS